MRLVELEPDFIGKAVGRDDGTDAASWERLPSVDGAQGLIFLCPTCYQANGGNVGTHAIVCWLSEGRNAQAVPAHWNPGPGRWLIVGDTFETLTLNAHGARSVLLRGGCNAHFHITNGEIQPA